MFVHVEPVNFEIPQERFDIVGYYNGKAIAKDILGNLYYLECDEVHAPVGIAMESDILESIKKLPAWEEQAITKIYQHAEVPELIDYGDLDDFSDIHEELIRLNRKTGDDK